MAKHFLQATKMTLNYTKLGTLLLRIQGLVIIAKLLPSFIVSISQLSKMNSWGTNGLNHSHTVFVLPFIGLILFLFADGIAKRTVGYLDKGGEA